MKKLLSLAIVLALVLSACGGVDPGVTEPGEDPTGPAPSGSAPSTPSATPSDAGPDAPSDPGTEPAPSDTEPVTPPDTQPSGTQLGEAGELTLPAPDYFSGTVSYSLAGKSTRFSADFFNRDILEPLGYAGLLLSRGCTLAAVEKSGTDVTPIYTLCFTLNGADAAPAEGYDCPVALELTFFSRGAAISCTFSPDIHLETAGDVPGDSDGRLALWRNVTDRARDLNSPIELTSSPWEGPDTVMGETTDPVALPAPDNFIVPVRYDSMGLVYLMASLTEDELPQAQGYLGLIGSRDDFELIGSPEDGFDPKEICDYHFAYTGDEDVRNIPGDSGDSAVVASFYPDGNTISFTVVFGLGIRLDHDKVPANDSVSLRLWDALLDKSKPAQLASGDLVDAAELFCDTCHGSGACPVCGGDGRVYDSDAGSESALCPSCHGLARCGDCDGVGKKPAA